MVPEADELRAVALGVGGVPVPAVQSVEVAGLVRGVDRHAHKPRLL
jgi:hypothetical protein